jgi:5,10-methenyltetrahydrofolate synthetase
MSFYSWSESDQLINNRFGIPEPDPNSKNCFLVNPDCILIPCVGWGFYHNQYWRLGYGGGYFDRTIFNLKNEGHLFKTVGIAYDWQKLNHDLWRPQDHDQPLDYVLTNSSIYPKVSI